MSLPSFQPLMTLSRMKTEVKQDRDTINLSNKSIKMLSIEVTKNNGTLITRKCIITKLR